MSSSLLAYNEQILQIDRQLEECHRRIHELHQLRNSYVPINRLPLDVLRLIFEEVGQSNFCSDGDDILYWHRNIVHVCQHWRSVGLDMPSIWDELTLPNDVTVEELNYYIPRARKSQRIVLQSEEDNWELVLSLLNGSECRIDYLTALGYRSCRDFLRVATRFEVTSTIAILHLSSEDDDDVLFPPDMPLLTSSSLEDLRLEGFFLLPWSKITGQQFTHLQSIYATVPMTCREDCISFLNALRDMTSIKQIQIFQSRGRVRVIELENIYQELKDKTNRDPLPRLNHLMLADYGALEIQILLTALSLDDLKRLTLQGSFYLSANHFLQIHGLLQRIVSKSFTKSTQSLSLTWSPKSRNFEILGFSEKQTPGDLFIREDRVLCITGSSESNSLEVPASQHLRDVLSFATMLAPEATALTICNVYCKRLPDSFLVRGLAACGCFQATGHA
ncbi:hypothetical protein AX16_005824 [Volvariella volvacea WC 439]|nr:hypothetical protein AX16_005824 [Volvariella volvacea WC 439]